MIVNLFICYKGVHILIFSGNIFKNPIFMGYEIIFTPNRANGIYFSVFEILVVATNSVLMFQNRTYRVLNLRN